MPNTTIKYISEASEKVIGYKPEYCIGINKFDYFSGEDLQKLHEMMDFVLNNPSEKSDGVVRLNTTTGKVIYLKMQMQNLLHEPAIEGIAVNFRDIIQRMESLNRVYYLSIHNQLTGLPTKVDC